jgi:UDP-N-acetylmuramoyl-L-alanyl-D-glutamate--2,6-diaminopimelate ligase
MKDFFRKLIPLQHPLRLFYYKFMAMLAANFYRFPANELKVIAITGTNGKTTSSNMLHSILSEAGHKTGLCTTVNFKIGSFEEPNLYKQTTIPPFVLQRKLREMVNANCEFVIVETTSHAMIQSRIWGVNVDTAAFTNLTQDHLSYHGTMEAYKEAKGLLFRHLNASQRKPNIPKVAVINQDDPSAEFFNKFPVDQSFPYGIQQGTYVARDLELRPDGTTFTIRIPNGETRVSMNIPGRMNVYNAMTAATIAVAHKVNLQAIKSALESMKPVAGRLEAINEGQPFTAIVDYAHSEDSLEQLLSMFKELTKGRLIVVFGATGGGRDQAKRPIMGAVAHKHSDLLILTDDDPYEEDSNEIARMVREGIPREEGDRFWQVLDRREAIHLALSLAKEGDTVVVAGKGAEAFQVVGKRRVPHDDRQVVREFLSRAVDIEVPSV